MPVMGCVCIFVLTVDEKNGREIRYLKKKTRSAKLMASSKWNFFGATVKNEINHKVFTFVPRVADRSCFQEPRNPYKSAFKIVVVVGGWRQGLSLEFNKIQFYEHQIYRLAFITSKLGFLGTKPYCHLIVIFLV